jgi:FAD/FMN-containing dehydrogenase
MPQEWVNWSGSLRFTPGRVEKPESEEEVCALVKDAAARSLTVRPVGAGHSSTPLVETDGVLVSLENMTGMVSSDFAAREATFMAATALGAAGTAMRDNGLEVHNLGDVFHPDDGRRHPDGDPWYRPGTEKY